MAMDPKLGKRFRKMIIPRPGHLLVEADYTAFHALTTGFEAQDLGYMRLARLDIHSYVTAHMIRDPDRDKLITLPDDELGDRLNWIKEEKSPFYKSKQTNFIRNKQAKPCIAEGQLVLTNKGLVPIENITIEHRLWDGVEWVQHEGLIYQGIQEVITYDGITATPDHKVYREDGKRSTLREAASALARLETTGVEGKAIWPSNYYHIDSTTGKRLYSSSLSMPNVQDYTLDRQGEPFVWPIQWLSGLQPNEVEASDCIRAPLRCDHSPMLEPTLQDISSLRGSRDRVQIQESERVRTVGSEESASSELQGNRDRPDRQQRPLRAGELAIGNQTRADVESPDDGHVRVLGKTGEASRVSESIPGSLDQNSGSTWNDRRADHTECYRRSELETQGLARNRTETTKVRVYDILNAGPRSRFTVSGKLVANCILGIGFGLGDKHAYEMNEEYFSSIKEVTAIKQLLKGLFPKVFQWQDKVRLEAHDLGYLTTLHGYIRYFWDVYRWDPKRRETVPGEDSERAIAFRPANDAFGHIKDTKLRLARRPEGNLLREYGFINPMHDAILFDCPMDRVEECLRTVKWEMERKSEILKNIAVPDGLWCGVETMVGPNWAEMKVVHWKGDEILWPEGMEIGSVA